MKLLVFHQALAPYRVDFFNGLASRFDMELVLFDTNLVNQKFDQHKLVGALKCRVSYLLGGFRWKDRYFRTGAIRKVWREKPDIVLGCEYSLVTIALALYRFAFRAKYKLWTITDDNLAQFKARRGLKAILRWLFIRLLDGIIVTNDETRRAYEAITPEKSKIKYAVVPILHDEAIIRADAAEVIAAGKKWRRSNLAAFAKVVLFVGRLDAVKNVKWLVTHVGGMDGIALVMVGSGPQDEELAEMVRRTGWNNIFLEGRKEGRAVYEMMAMADVLVLPSAFEPYGAVVGEALQWGTPCVVSDRVGAKLLINAPSCGGVFTFGDAEDFRLKLDAAIALPKREVSLIPDLLGETMDGLEF